MIFPHVTREKGFPSEYEAAVFAALSEYPEVSGLRIHFRTAKSHPVLYGTTPRPLSFFLPARKRVYHITLLEESEGPQRQALFRNLPAEVQRAVIAHELAHVVQFNGCTIPGMWKTALLYPFGFYKKKLERDADKKAIMHGFGEELFAMARFVRSIPGYTVQRPEIIEHYLSPQEIVALLGKKAEGYP